MPDESDATTAAIDAYELALATADDLEPDEMIHAPDMKLNIDPLPDMDDHDEAGNPKPWAQKENETPRAYALFMAYLSQPRSNRTQAAVARHYKITSASVSATASRHGWGLRARKWDEERDRIYQAEVFDRMREMGERHGNKLEKAIDAIALPLEIMADRIQEDPEGVAAQLGEKSITQLHNMAIQSARALPNLMTTERLARGLPTEITANVHSGTIEHVYTPDISDLATILQGLVDAGAIAVDAGTIIDATAIVDAEVEPVHSDETYGETDGLPPS
jgi:hypothetical protein